MMKTLIPLLLLARESSGFSATSMNSKVFGRPALALHSTKSFSEEDASYIMSQASACAHSDTCSIDDANNYLEAVVSVQGDCTANVLVDDAVCGDADNISEIVALLRAKVEASETVNMELASSQGEGKYSLIPVYAVLTALTFALSTTVNHDVNVDSFTSQEWMWAVRDGYLDTMISAFAKNGGLISEVNTFNVDTVHVPFTAEEWMWSIRDGYFDDMVQASFRHGGI